MKEREENRPLFYKLTRFDLKNLHMMSTISSWHASLSLTSAYLSKSNSGTFKVFAKGSSGERNSTIASFVLLDKNDGVGCARRRSPLQRATNEVNFLHDTYV